MIHSWIPMLHAFICICAFPEPSRLQLRKPFSASTYKTPAIKELFNRIFKLAREPRCTDLSSWYLLQDPVLQSGTVSEWSAAVNS